MRFTLVTQYFPPEIGAPQVRLAGFARALRDAGHRVTIVTAVPNYPEGKIWPEFRYRFIASSRWDGMPVHRVFVVPAMGSGVARMVNYLSFAVLAPLTVFRVPRSDYVFVESPPPTTAIPGWLLSRVRGGRLVLNVADLWPDSAVQLGVLRSRRQRAAALALERWAYRVSFAVTAVTRGIQEALVRDKKVPPERVLFLPNGVDQRTFAPMQPDDALRARLGLQGKKVLLYAGTLGLAHGLETTLEAMRLVGNRRDDLVLLLVGDGSARRGLEDTATRLALANVRFMPAIPPRQVSRIYSMAFAGLASARDIALSEGARSAKISAIMGCGKPVIYAGRGEGSRLVESIGAGISVPPGDAEGLATAIEVMADDPMAAEEMGRRGLEYVTEVESWGVLVRDWVDQLMHLEQLSPADRGQET
jgi:glycosyltransferase involved in cell wall biosynthesis